ncbi:MAG: Tim44 domain-containing protein, partial [Gammaproteobacteria bacterium]|nr:Tim44 domain-containing protein [Gammaproteobacteria bacterium]
ASCSRYGWRRQPSPLRSRDLGNGICRADYDAGDLDDRHQFTAPEVFAELRVRLRERGGAAQHTDVAEVHAEAVEVAEENPMQIVSVRYHGRVVEEQGAEAMPFDEMWHLVRPLNGGRGWAIVGLLQIEHA